MPVFSTSERISASACAYAAPLPRMMSGFFAPFSTSSARLTASGAGIWRGAGSTTLMSERLPGSASMDCAKSFAGRLRAAVEVVVRDRRQAVGRIDAVQCQGIDHQLKAGGHLSFCVAGNLGFDGTHGVLL